MTAATTTVEPAARSRGARPVRRHPATLAVALLVAGLTVWHGIEASQHLLTDRDPGVYVTTGRWLAREGSLLVDPAVGPFAGRSGLVFEEQGWNLDDDGRLEPQFLHLLPVVLAGAHLLGGDRLLLLAPPVIAGLALLATYAFASRLVRPWWALAAVSALSVSVPWVHVSRDAFSEPLAVLLLFAGLRVLWDARARDSWRRAAIAGLLLGGVATARVEGFVLLLPLLAFAGVELAGAQGAPRPARRSAWRCTAGLVGGAGVTAGLAVADLVLFSTWYLEDLGGLLSTVAAGLALTAVAGAVAVALAAVLARRSPAPSVAAPSRRRAAHVAAAGVVLLVAGLWFARPLASTVTGDPSAAIAAVEAAEGRTADGTRRYSEHSFEWLAWYLGPVALAVGAAGAALLTHRLVRAGLAAHPSLPFVLVFATVSLLYLWRPSIVPDHVWAMRRFVIVTIPGFLVLAALAGQALQDRLAAAGRAVAGGLAAGATTVAMVGFPVWTLVPVAGMTTQEGVLGQVREVCDAVGEDGAVVVARGAELELVAGQALRAFCGVPVAIAGAGLTPADVGALRAAWAAEGRTLHVVGATPDVVASLGGQVPERTVVVPNDQALEATLTSRPDELVSRPITLVVAEVAKG